MWNVRSSGPSKKQAKRGPVSVTMADAAQDPLRAGASPTAPPRHKITRDPLCDEPKYSFKWQVIEGGPNKQRRCPGGCHQGLRPAHVCPVVLLAPSPSQGHTELCFRTRRQWCISYCPFWNAIVVSSPCFSFHCHPAFLGFRTITAQ